MLPRPNWATSRPSGGFPASFLRKPILPLRPILTAGGDECNHFCKYSSPPWASGPKAVAGDLISRAG